MVDDKTKSLVYLVRHGETAWSKTGQHTGRNDLPLTAEGEAEAAQLKERLAGVKFGHVFSSPLQRARKTCELAGFGAVAEIDDQLIEWNYGDYEGLKSVDIRAKRSGWNPFHDGFPGGESVAEISSRADRVIARIRSLEGNVLIFAHAHFLRFLATRWLTLPPEDARSFLLGTTAVSILGYDPGSLAPAIVLWNDRHHITG